MGWLLLFSTNRQAQLTVLIFTGLGEGSKRLPLARRSDHLENGVDHGVVRVAHPRDRARPANIHATINYQFIVDVNSNHAAEGHEVTVCPEGISML